MSTVELVNASANSNLLEVLRQRSWSWLLKRVFLPAGDLALGQNMIKRLRFLEEAQWWEPARVAEYRDRTFQTLMEVTYREVPFYRDLMERSGVTPSDLQRPQDLSRLPIVTKAMLRAGYPERTTRATRFRTYEAASSGSTGANFIVKTDTETEGSGRASFLLACEWAGWQIGDPHLQTGMTLKRSRGRWLKDFILRCHYVSAFDLGDAQLDRSLELLDKNKIEHLWGYPGSLYFLARRAIEKGWNRPLRSIITWGDNLYPNYRSTIESAFKRRIFDTYGCGEGIQVSAQCGEMNTYHIHDLDVLAEFLDDEGNPVAPGEFGNLILTRLHPGPMPLIRYQVGDIGVRGDGRRCECGRGFQVMESIQGRDTDVVVTPSGNRLIVHFFTGICEHFPEIESFQVVQEKLDSIMLRIVPTKHYSEDSTTKIIAALRAKGADLRIEVELVSEIPTASSGKRRFVISKVSKPFVESPGLQTH
jgi:phenylacetate-CoA ligase